MARLAEFLGIPCETLALTPLAEHREFLERNIPAAGSCLVVNPQVMEEWVGRDGIPAEVVDFLLSRFAKVVVHGLRISAFDSELVTALSRGRLKSVEAINPGSAGYSIASDAKDVCEAFAGLSFGPANLVNDHVLSSGISDPAVRRLISIGDRPFMATAKTEGAEVFFVASEDVVDLNTDVDPSSLAEYFSRFLPHAMALRYAAGYECWRASEACASIIIDDVLLRQRYGFLKPESLLRLAKQHDFHSSIAFIPHNFRRSSSGITRMFQENAAHLSICFHGNDHTEGEFAITDQALICNLLRVAEDRMKLHQQMTGLSCDRVMVFPQGKYSIEAMKILKAHDFCAAVSTVTHTAEQPIRLTIGELAQPAVLRYEGFPLFIRKTIWETRSYDIAFSLFFGRPLLIGGHHDIFQHPESLVEIVTEINSMAPGIRWSNLETVVENSFLARRAPDGTRYIRAYSGTVRVSNDSESIGSYSIEWSSYDDRVAIEQVRMDGAPFKGFEVDNASLRLSVELAPGDSRTFSLVHRKTHETMRALGLLWRARAFLRRRLSEVRDNWLSKNQGVLTAAKAFQRHFLKV